MAVDIAKLNIEITDNASGAATSVTSLAEALTKLRNADAGTEMGRVATGLFSINKNVSGLGRLQNDLAQCAVSASTLADKLAEINRYTSGTSLKVSASLPKVEDYIDPTRADVNAWAMEQASALEGVGNATRTATTANSEFAESQKTVASETKQTSNEVKKFQIDLKGFSSLIPNIVSQFGRLVKMRIMRTIVKNILSGISEGLQNLYNWAKVTGNGFVDTMNSMATAGNYLKNSTGAAFGSLLNTIAPIIDRIVDWLVTGINYVNMFFAVLSGSSTYTKAKKIATEYGNAVSNAAGGATGAVEELKASLTTLDFDELHQLQEQASPSGGGGGGGGGGSTGTNYGDMFEQAAIEQNWLTKTAQWLKDNFKDVLTYVTAIGAGILGWKISSALANALGLLSKAQAFGIGLMITGTILSAKGGFDLATEGWDLKGILESSLGVLATSIGGALTFGALVGGGMGFMIGFSIGLTAWIIGYAQGLEMNFQESLENDPVYQNALEELHKANEQYEVLTDIVVKINETRLEYNQEQTDLQLAQQIKDKLAEFEGVDATEENIAIVKALVDELNASGILGEFQAQWDITAGKIHTNADEIQGVIDKMDALSKAKALHTYQELLNEATKEYYEAQMNYDRENGVYEGMLDRLEAYKEWYNSLIGLTPEEETRREMVTNWNPGDGIPDVYSGVPEYIRILMAEINAQSDVVAKYADNLSFATAAMEELNAEIEKLYGQTIKTKTQTMRDLATDLGINYSEQTGFNQKPYQNVTPFSYVAPSKAITTPKTQTPQTSRTTQSANTATKVETPRITTPTSKQIEENINQQQRWNTIAEEGWKELQRGLNIYSDVTKNANYYTQSQKKATGVVDQYREATKQTTDTVKAGSIAWKDAKNEQYAFAKSAEYTSKAQKNNGVVSQAVARIVSSSYGSVLSDTTGMSDAISGIGSNADYPTIGQDMIAGFNSLGSQMLKIGSGIKTQISGEINVTGQAIKAGQIESETTKTFKSVNFKGVGSWAKYTIEQMMNTTGKDLNASNIQGTVLYKFKGQKWAMSGDVVKNAIESAISKTGTGVGYLSILSYMANGFKNAAARTSFDGAGKNIADNLAYSIAKNLNSKSVSTAVQTTLGNTTSSAIMRTKFVATAYAKGGYPKTGALYLAQERGSEMIGTIGGKNAVANNDQIASAIARALSPMLNGGGGTTNVTVKMDSATVARASMKGQKAMNRQYNITATA